MGDFVQEVAAIFSENGPLARYAARTGRPYALREQQISMAKFVAETFVNGQIGIVEAGTGVGKSFAYLVPALLLAARQKKRVVVATNKINLQEQLINKDLPMLTKALGLDVSRVLIKGRNNYLSRRRLKNAMSGIEPGFFYEIDVEALRLIADWAKNSETGDKAELERVLEEKRLWGAVDGEILDRVLQVWPEVQSDPHDCREHGCPHYRECFFFRSRERAEQTDIVVTNQHVLVFDHFVAQGTKGKARILPSFDLLVVDEAHSLVGAVTSALQKSIDAVCVPRMVRRLLARRINGFGSRGEHTSLLEKLSSNVSPGVPREILQDRLPPLLRELEKEWEDCFANIESLATHCRNEIASKNKNRSQGSGELRQIPYPPDRENYKGSSWNENPDFCPHSRIFEIQSNLEFLVKQLCETIAEASPPEPVQDLYQRVLSLLTKLSDFIETLRKFADLQDKQWCRWFQCDAGAPNNGQGLKLCVASIDVAKQIADMLTTSGEVERRMVLTSATLTVRNQFDYVLRDWGLAEAHKQGAVRTLTVDSPFDYSKQCVLAVPTNLPDQKEDEKKFQEQARELILDTLEISQGHAFLLFTGWRQLEDFWGILKEELERRGFTVLRQEPEGNRNAITDQFRKAHAPVLFGVASFWEGVDIAGDQLRCVIIVKLPFPVPSDPLLSARAERWGYRGWDVFLELQKPLMITALRQGFGRLIRTEKDYGVVLILDSRLHTKSYGEEVLESLPPAQVVKLPSNKIIPAIRQFFARRDKSR